MPYHQTVGLRLTAILLALTLSATVLPGTAGPAGAQGLRDCVDHPLLA